MMENNEIKALLEVLKSENGLDRKTARKALVSKGEEAIPFLNQLVSEPNHTVKWEALKTLQEIANPVSIPVFIDALDEESSDLRWIGAEGLIGVGTEAIKPLLLKLTQKTSSVFVLAGAHHVFFEMHKKGMLAKDFPVEKMLSTLKNPGMEGLLKTLVYEILENK